LIPWEKLPAPAAGLGLIVLNAIVLSSAQPYSLEQVEPVLMIIAGVGLFVFGVRKTMAEADIPESEKLATMERKKTAHLAPPDYSKYSEAELRQILARIDGERYPERVSDITERIARLAQ